jgi:cell division protein YceG involved in septum cleavage
MKRLTVILMALALVLAGATLVLAQDVPQALKGVNLTTAQVVTPAQAQQIRGAAGTDNNNGIFTANELITHLYYTKNVFTGRSTGPGTYNAAAAATSSVLNQLYSGNTPPSGLPTLP